MFSKSSITSIAAITRGIVNEDTSSTQSRSDPDSIQNSEIEDSKDSDRENRTVPDETQSISNDTTVPVVTVTASEVNDFVN